MRAKLKVEKLKTLVLNHFGMNDFKERNFSISVVLIKK